MKDTDYAFCVARIRANEADMLDMQFLNKLAECDGYEKSVEMLKSVGWIDEGESLTDYISLQNEKLWNLLYESVPSKKELDCLCVLNDFFNIKVAIKCFLVGKNAENFFVKPTTLSINDLAKAAQNADFSFLNKQIMKQTAIDAYETASKTENGQNAEIIIDCAALNYLKSNAEKLKDELYAELTSFIVDMSNIKTAFRCATTKKSRTFIQAAISECFYLDRGELTENSFLGVEKLKNYLEGTRYTVGAELYCESPATFDKWCDDNIVEIAKKAKYTSFGFGPVCAYYYAKSIEIKSVRMILASKCSDIPNELIIERLRKTYV